MRHAGVDMRLRSIHLVVAVFIASASTSAARPTLTRKECLDQGGSIVGDIGNGAIFREDYRCVSNGEPPLADIVPLPGEPVATEGEVCCGPPSDGTTVTSGSEQAITFTAVTGVLTAVYLFYLVMGTVPGLPGDVITV